MITCEQLQAVAGSISMAELAALFEPADKQSSPFRCLRERDISIVRGLIGKRDFENSFLQASITHLGSCERCSKLFLAICLADY